eukprot:TRINITY_DN12300_c0_g1_i1.p1 TRINITY_DN12300_c0_g1~~TRINITY_DN12300_c0_g1_i1.p1  ORF type:complete len:486 (+),score=95.31 TRINITY_DN12300_c0_g1_i1:118-1458(+)
MAASTEHPYCVHSPPRLGLAVALLVALVQPLGCASSRSFLRSLAKSMGSSSSFSGPDSFVPSSFLIFSSSGEKKVSYIQVVGPTLGSSVVRPLIDWGLEWPRGIAVANDGKSLFVSDKGSKKILYYDLLVMACPENPKASDLRCRVPRGWKEEPPKKMLVVGTQVTLMENIQADWITVDSAGAVFFSDEETKSVIRIEPGTVKKVKENILAATDLQLLDFGKVKALTIATRAARLGSGTHQSLLQGIEAFYTTSAFTLFQAGNEDQANVGTPAGLAVEDGRVYWANIDDGQAKGAVASGLAAPLKYVEETGSADALETEPAALGCDSASGVVLTPDKIIYTGAEFVYGADRYGGVSVALSDHFTSPRGLAWDEDGTVYVADESENAIYSIPVGRLAKGVAVTPVVNIDTPFGLAYMSWKSCSGPPAAAAWGLVVAVVLALAPPPTV